MKLGDHNNALLSNYEGKTENFGIGDVAIVIGILRDRIYTKKITTMAQEYISNARDACREAKTLDNHFEVTLPSALEPVFKVRDYGIGVSPDRMSKVFIQYGASTKRSDNSATGGFGLGAKIGFAVSDSFSIVTYIDGMKRSYVAHVGVSNQGQLDLVSSERTDEKNGTEIQVPILGQDINECRDAVLRAVYFWKDRPILKGLTREPELLAGLRIGNVAEIVNRGTLPDYTEANYEWRPLVLIDGIPYQINEALLSKCPTLVKLSSFVKQKLILHVGNGVVEVAASRETIEASKVSIEALEKIAKSVSLEVRTYIAEKFGKVGGVTEWVETYTKLNSVFSVEEGFAKYEDYHITNKVVRSANFTGIKFTEIHCLGRNGQIVNKITKRELRERVIPIDRIQDVFFSKADESLVAQNRRLRAYFENPGKNRIILLERQDNFTIDPVTQKSVLLNNGVAELDKVIKELEVKDITSLVYTLPPKEKKVKVPREKTEFCMHVLDGGRFRYTTLADNTTNWLYVPVTDAGWQGSVLLSDLKDLRWYLLKFHQLDICGLSEKALAMVKNSANFKPLDSFLEKYKVTKEEIVAAKHLKSINRSQIEILESLKGIEDKRLTDAIKEYQSFQKVDNDLAAMPKTIRKIVEEKAEIKEFIKRDIALDALFKEVYPLVTEVGRYSPVRAELKFYLNAKFGK